MWYTYHGRPVISAWNSMSDLKNRQDLSEMLDYCANRFKQDFGVKPLWVLQDNWLKYDGRLNNSDLVLGKHSWFSKARKINATYATHDGYIIKWIWSVVVSSQCHLEDIPAYHADRRF